jgi:uncharacterized caspase-like protein
MLLLFLVFTLIVFDPLPLRAAAPEKRVALVIGNSAYKHTAPLDNPKNDAADMAAALRKFGFDVIEGFDLGKAGLEGKIRDFAAALSGAEVGVFFYAGHGLQAAGQNYLIPTDAALTSASALDFETVRLELVHRTMERETKTNILFLDACRNNPLTRNLARAMGTRSVEIGRGLAPVESGAGTLISFSTQPGNVALDGTGRNSPFSGALVKQLSSASDDLSAILINVRNEVMKATQDRQVPWEHSALRGRFWFKGAPPGPAALAAASSAESPESEAAQTWRLIESMEDVSVFEAFRKRYGTDNPVFDRIAASRIDALKSRREQKLAAAPPVPPGAHSGTGQTPTGKGVAELLQRELQRVGCYDGGIDGVWGTSSQSAVSRFNLHANTALPTDRAETRSVEAVQKMLERVCPESSVPYTLAAGAPSQTNTNAEALRTLSEFVKLGVTLKDAARAKQRSTAHAAAPVATDAVSAPGRPAGFKEPAPKPLATPGTTRQTSSGATPVDCRLREQQYYAAARTSGAPGTMGPLMSMYQYLQCNCGHPPSPQLPPCPR